MPSVLGACPVAPIQRRDSVNLAGNVDELMQVLTIDGEASVLFTQEAAAYPVKGLGTVVADLSPQAEVLLNVLDRLVG